MQIKYNNDPKLGEFLSRKEVEAVLTELVEKVGGMVKNERSKVWEVPVSFGVGKYMLGSAGEKIAYNQALIDILLILNK